MAQVEGRLHESERSAGFRDHCREVHGIMVDGLDRRTLAFEHRADHASPGYYSDHSPSMSGDESDHGVADVRKWA